MNKLTPVFLLFLFGLSACVPAVEASPTSTSLPSLTASRTLEPSATQTHTPTVVPTETPVPLTPTLEVIPTSDFDNFPKVFYTPASPALCPPESQVTLELPDAFPDNDEDAEKMILEILNSGGVDQLLTRLPDYPHTLFSYEDLTNDGVRELIITPNFKGALMVFSCVDEKFKKMLAAVPPWDRSPIVLAIQDLNQNGVQELVISFLTCHYCTAMQVFEWNGKDFDNLTKGCRQLFGYDRIYCADYIEMEGYSSASVEDIDKDGFYELVLEGGTPSWITARFGEDGPYREEREIYKWDGHKYSWYSHTYDPPNFRYESVQDGDIATHRGDYQAALSFYQAAIFDDQLKSWDDEAWKSLLGQDYPDIRRMPFNRVEYDQLSAYARYRIVLLHLRQGWDGDAKVVYDALVEKYPVGNSGHPYVEMATIFWEDYQETRNFALACQKAISYAELNQNILKPLGPHGYFDLNYKPETVCLFDGP